MSAKDLTDRPSQRTPHLPKRCAVLVPFHQHIETATEAGLRCLEQLGYPVVRQGGVSAIDRIRNEMAMATIEAGFTEIMWIDSDIMFQPESVAKLASHGLPFVCGAYAKKDKSGFAHRFQEESNVPFGSHGKLIKISACGMGFALTQAAMYDITAEKLKLPRYLTPSTTTAFPWFMPMIHVEHGSTLYLSEDYAFCQRVRSAGFEVMCDTSVMLGHIGKYIYSCADLAATLGKECADETTTKELVVRNK